MKKKHGHALTANKHSTEYYSWKAMRQRCDNPNNQNYFRYGGRGISYPEQWKDFTCFLNDMGLKPNNKFSLERIDNNKSYSKENCIWATSKTQANNRKSNNNLTYKGKTQTIMEWSRELKLSRRTITDRLSRGLAVEEILNTFNKQNNIYPFGVEKISKNSFRVRKVKQGKRYTLYTGPDLFEACCIAKSNESL